MTFRSCDPADNVRIQVSRKVDLLTLKTLLWVIFSNCLRWKVPFKMETQYGKGNVDILSKSNEIACNICAEILSLISIHVYSIKRKKYDFRGRPLVKSV